MYIYQTALKNQYYDKVIDLYVNKHLSSRRISAIIPLSKTTILRWIANFAKENLEVPIMYKRTVKPKKVIVEPEPRQELPDDVKALQAELMKVKEELRKEKLRADACKGCQDLSGSGTLQAVWRIKAGILSKG